MIRLFGDNSQVYKAAGVDLETGEREIGRHHDTQAHHITTRHHGRRHCKKDIKEEDAAIQDRIRTR